VKGGIMGCELCETIDWKEGKTYRMVECNTCKGVMMLVVREHRNFTNDEKELIKFFFEKVCPDCEGYNDKVRFEQRRIKNHGHCHLE